MNALQLGSAREGSTDTFFDDLYDGFHIQRLSIFRSVCSIAEKRKPVNELLIRNY